MSEALILLPCRADILVDLKLMNGRWPTFLAGTVMLSAGVLALPISTQPDQLFTGWRMVACAVAFAGLGVFASVRIAADATPVGRDVFFNQRAIVDPTVEDLARALHARDGSTHLHTRRVQVYAVELAQSLGLNDEGFLERLRSAALLHDVGKLAMPERILNKPGRLTSTEMETMKLHAEIGADMLQAVGVDPNVVAFVRHHHESWNGAGYPERLKGPDIPVGARILAVADCFDALTSDRPYRRRLSDGQALKILVKRRGSMYEPQIVDAFFRVYPAVTPPKRRLVNLFGRRTRPLFH